MRKYNCIFVVLSAVLTTVHCGFLGSPVGYSSGFHGSPLPFAAPAPAHVTTTTYTSPVAPFSINSYAASSHHTYASSAPHANVVNYNSGITPFHAYASGPKFTKFSVEGHIPSAYSRGPLSYDFPPSTDFSGWEAPSAVVKLHLPVETYDGGWDVPNAVVKFAAPVAPVAPVASFNGWKAPRTVVKFGPPTTTTTTTYSAAGVAAVGAPHAYATPFAGPVGW